jgi:hypothetical protein
MVASGGFSPLLGALYFTPLDRRMGIVPPAVELL